MECDVDDRARPLLERFRDEEGPSVSRADGEALAFLAGFASLDAAYDYLDTLGKEPIEALGDKEVLARAALTYPEVRNWAHIPAEDAREAISAFEALPPTVAEWLDYLDHVAIALAYEEPRVLDPSITGAAERVRAYRRDQEKSARFRELLSEAEEERRNALTAIDDAHEVGRRAQLVDSELSALLKPNGDITSARDMRDFGVPAHLAEEINTRRRMIKTILGRYAKAVRAAEEIAERLLAEERARHDKATQVLAEHLLRAQNYASKLSQELPSEGHDD